jgi:CubicO group peptidase (beta-lactamase class C family)
MSGQLVSAAFAVLALSVLGANPGWETSRKVDLALGAETQKGFSGAVLVMQRDAILLDRGYGAMLGAPVRAGSKFWIASAGKQFVSAAILKCRDRGLLSLDDPVSRFFPDRRRTSAPSRCASCSRTRPVSIRPMWPTTRRIASRR